MSIVIPNFEYFAIIQNASFNKGERVRVDLTRWN
jgi:hypothetical protein